MQPVSVSRPAMDPKIETQSTTSTPPASQPKARACEACTRRKIKCDKVSPQCSACTKSRIDCHYEVPTQGRAKRKAATDIHERLDKYEKILERHGLLEATPRDPREVETMMNPFLQPQRVVDPSKAESQPGGIKCEITESELFTKIRDAVQSNPNENTPGRNMDSTLLDPEAALASAALFGTVPFTPSLTEYHPTYEVAMKLWKLYQQNVDPVTKLLHAPTVGLMLQQAARDPTAISERDAECLIFAIYHITTLTMSDSDVRDVFGHSDDVRDKYHDAMRIALISCQYYRTSSLKVLQALVLLLLSLRGRCDTDTLWTLTGNSMRIAQRMKVHRDGTELGLPPFETEMRRRLWCLMLSLDASTGRLAGVGGGPVVPSFWDTKRPLNINDDDISPATATAPESRHTATDMLFCLVKIEIGGFHHKIRHKIGGWFRETDSEGHVHFEQALAALKTTIEEKYIRYCDITLPIHYFTVAMARAALDYGELQLRLQQDRKSMSLSQNKAAYALALRILDHDIACNLNPAISRFAWFRADFLQWGPLIWILNELGNSRRDATEIETAWEKIDQVYGCHPEIQSCSRNIDLALGKLTLAAWDASLTLLPRKPEPSYVSTFRTFFTSSQLISTSQLGNQPPGNSHDIGAMEAIQHQDFLGALNMEMDWQFWEQFLRDSGNLTATSM